MCEAQVIGEASPHSYEITTPEGTYRRNRTALRPLPREDNGEDLNPEPASLEERSLSQSPPPQSQPDHSMPTELSEPTRHSRRYRHPPDRFDPSWA